jgi:hypothetical protein
MGCGQSSWDDEVERDYYTKRLNQLKQHSIEVILEKLESIQELSGELRKEVSHGSRYGFRLIDDLSNVANFTKW